MFKSTLRCFVYFMLLTTIGCGDQSEKNQSDLTSAVVDMPELAAYTGPAIAFRVTPGESATQFNWSVRVRSGGWNIKFDGALTNPLTSHATIKLLLTKPGPGEIVNQALATLTGEYRHGTQSFKTADLIVKQITRGEAAEDVPYERAEIWKADD